MLLIPALERKKQADLFDFENNLIYIVSSRAASATQRDLVSNKTKTKRKKKL